jgi:hypothetical protein
MAQEAEEGPDAVKRPLAQATQLNATLREQLSDAKREAEQATARLSELKTTLKATKLEELELEVSCQCHALRPTELKAGASGDGRHACVSAVLRPLLQVTAYYNEILRLRQLLAQGSKGSADIGVPSVGGASTEGTKLHAANERNRLLTRENQVTWGQTGGWLSIAAMASLMFPVASLTRCHLSPFFCRFFRSLLQPLFSSFFCTSSFPSPHLSFPLILFTQGSSHRAGSSIARGGTCKEGVCACCGRYESGTHMVSVIAIHPSPTSSTLLFPQLPVSSSKATSLTNCLGQTLLPRHGSCNRRIGYVYGVSLIFPSFLATLLTPRAGCLFLTQNDHEELDDLKEKHKVQSKSLRQAKEKVEKLESGAARVYHSPRLRCSLPMFSHSLP